MIRKRPRLCELFKMKKSPSMPVSSKQNIERQTSYVTNDSKSVDDKPRKTSSLSSVSISTSSTRTGRNSRLQNGDISKFIKVNRIPLQQMKPKPQVNFDFVCMFFFFLKFKT